MPKIPGNAKKLALEAIKLAKLSDFLRKECGIKQRLTIKQLRNIRNAYIL